MKVVQDWIDDRLKDIADKFPKLVDQDASAFKCGPRRWCNISSVNSD